MTSPIVRIKLYGIPDAEACVRGTGMRCAALASRYSALTAVLFELACHNGQYDAHVALHFPQHQIVVNAAGPTAEGAVHEAVSRAADELTRLEARDSSVATPPQAKAA